MSGTIDNRASVLLRVARAFGPIVEGEAVVSEEGFSPRYDLDRWSGIITKPGHKLEGTSIKDKICFFPTAKGGIAAGWAFNDIKGKGLAPKAFIFGIANPVMVMPAKIAPWIITGFAMPKMNARGAMPLLRMSLNAQPAAMPPFAVGKKQILSLMLTPSSLWPGFVIRPLQRSRS